MGRRLTEKSQAVERCVPIQSGGWLVVTGRGASGVSPEFVEVGTSVLIRDGLVILPERRP